MPVDGSLHTKSSRRAANLSQLSSETLLGILCVCWSKVLRQLSGFYRSTHGIPTPPPTFLGALSVGFGLLRPVWRCVWRQGSPFEGDLMPDTWWKMPSVL